MTMTNQESKKCDDHLVLQCGTYEGTTTESDGSSQTVQTRIRLIKQQQQSPGDKRYAKRLFGNGDDSKDGHYKLKRYSSSNGRFFEWTEDYNYGDFQTVLYGKVILLDDNDHDNKIGEQQQQQPQQQVALDCAFRSTRDIYGTMTLLKEKQVVTTKTQQQHKQQQITMNSGSSKNGDSAAAATKSPFLLSHPPEGQEKEFPCWRQKDIENEQSSACVTTTIELRPSSLFPPSDNLFHRRVTTVASVEG